MVSTESCVPPTHRLPDTLWERIAPMLPPDPPHPRGGRPFADTRQYFEGIWFLLRTGAQWCALPRCIGPKSTIHGRFQRWRALGRFQHLWWQILLAYDEEVGIEWTWQSLDGALGKAPLGGTATGPNPTDRGKLGTKRSLLTDGRGVPLAIVSRRPTVTTASCSSLLLRRGSPCLPSSRSTCASTRGMTFRSADRSLETTCSLPTSGPSAKNPDGWSGIRSGAPDGGLSSGRSRG